MKKVTFLLIGALIGTLFWSCDLLTDKPEEDIKKLIQDTVDEANAPVINVVIDTEGTGVAAMGNPKLGVPFSVDFTPFEGYAFNQWESESPGVVFANAKSTSTRVTVKNNPGAGTVILKPVSPARSMVTAKYPVPNSMSTVPGNRFILIEFSKPMKPASFGIESGTLIQDYAWENAYDPIEAVNFKGITIMGTPGYYPAQNYAQFFEPPVLSPDGKALYIYPRYFRRHGEPVLLMQWGTSIAVTVKGSVEDIYGNAMGKDETWTYNLNDPTDDYKWDLAPRLSGYSRVIDAAIVDGTNKTAEELASYFVLHHASAPSDPVITFTGSTSDHKVYIVFQTLLQNENDFRSIAVDGLQIYEQQDSGNYESFPGSKVSLMADGPEKDRIIAAFKKVPQVPLNLPTYVAEYTLGHRDPLPAPVTVRFAPKTGYDELGLSIPETNNTTTLEQKLSKKDVGYVPETLNTYRNSEYINIKYD